MKSSIAMAIERQETFDIGLASKLLGFPGGRIKFFKWLREKGFLLNDNSPKQSLIDRGWFILVKKKIKQVDPPIIVWTSRVTIHGLSELEQIVRREFPICKPCKEQLYDKQ
jgi:phage antirepressor YoqD-like protein